MWENVGAATTIVYELPNDGPVQLKVVDVLGRTAVTLVDSHAEAGRYSAYLDMDGLPSGVYTYVLQTRDRTLTRRLLVERPW